MIYAFFISVLLLLSLHAHVMCMNYDSTEEFTLKKDQLIHNDKKYLLPEVKSEVLLLTDLAQREVPAHLIKKDTIVEKRVIKDIKVDRAFAHCIALLMIGFCLYKMFN